jgi:hypothetical protein
LVPFVLLFLVGQRRPGGDVNQHSLDLRVHPPDFLQRGHRQIAGLDAALARIDDHRRLGRDPRA